MSQVNNKNPRTTPLLKKRLAQWRRSGVFTVNFEHISHLVLVFLFLTFSSQMAVG